MPESFHLVDSHAHLTDEQFSADVEPVIARALAAGVETIVTLGGDVESSRAAVALAEKHPAIRAAVGIHPEYVRRSSIEDLAIIRELAASPRVVAIGEIGLDYYWDKESSEVQRDFLNRQMELAAELDLPVCIHDREAHADILQTLRDHAGPRVRGVLHAFSGDAAMAHDAFRLGFIVSLAGPITFLNARRAPELVQALPLEKILVETDSPGLAPHPLRGKRNEPANVVRVAGRIAEIKGVTIDSVAAQTTRNARELFRLN